MKMSDVFEFGVCLHVRGGHIYNRYDEFTEAQANFTEDAIKNHDRLTEENEKLREALSDVIDGESKYDLANMNGHSLERCEEIIKLLEQTSD